MLLFSSLETSKISGHRNNQFPRTKKRWTGPFKLPVAIQDTNYHQIQPFLPSPLLHWNEECVQPYLNQLLKELFWGERKTPLRVSPFTGSSTTAHTPRSTRSFKHVYAVLGMALYLLQSLTLNNTFISVKKWSPLRYTGNSFSWLVRGKDGSRTIFSRYCFIKKMQRQAQIKDATAGKPLFSCEDPIKVSRKNVER